MSSNLILFKVEEVESQKLKFNSKYHKEVPEFNSEDAKIRFNVAAIVKEEHKLRAKEREEAERIKNLEINMRDSTEFENWKRKNEEREKIEELEYLQKSKKRDVHYKNLDNLYIYRYIKCIAYILTYKMFITVIIHLK